MASPQLSTQQKAYAYFRAQGYEPAFAGYRARLNGLPVYGVMADYPQERERDVLDLIRHYRMVIASDNMGARAGDAFAALLGAGKTPKTAFAALGFPADGLEAFQVRAGVIVAIEAHGFIAEIAKMSPTAANHDVAEDKAA